MNRVMKLAVLAALLVACVGAAKHRRDKTVVVRHSQARLEALSGRIVADGGLEVTACFQCPGLKLDPGTPGDTSCVTVDGAAVLKWLNGEPLEKWKDKNGF